MCFPHSTSFRTLNSCAPVAIALLLTAFPFRAPAQIVAQWVGESGAWNNAANWDIGVVPKNSGANTYSVIVDVTAAAVITLTENITISSLVNRESLKIETTGKLSILGPVSNHGTITAAGSFQTTAATLTGTGGVLVADGGYIALTDTVVNGGSLRVTDKAASQVRFSGDVTLSGIAWIDDGAGEFVVLNSTARLLGDYAHSLPAGCTLVVWVQHAWQEARLTLPSGEFQNNGVLVVRHSGGGYAVHPRLHFQGPAVLSGAGEVLFDYANANENEQPWIDGEPGATLTISASQTVHGSGDIRLPVLNQGTLKADRKDRPLVVTGSCESTGLIISTNQGRLALQGGFINKGSVTLQTNGWLTLTGPVSTDRDLWAQDGAWIMLENASANLASHFLIAAGGGVSLNGSTVTNGKLRVTDNPSSQIRFAGDVTLTGVPWQDDGAGEFVVLNTTARLLGDYEHSLPAGCNLVIWNQHSWQEPRFTVPAGDYLNQGMFELRHSGGGYAVHPRLHFEGSATLGGNGEIFFNYSGANDNEQPWITGEPGATLTIGPSQWLHGHGVVQLPILNQGIVEGDRKDRTLSITSPFRNEGTLSAVSQGRLALEAGLTNRGTVNLETNGWLTITGPCDTDRDLVARSGAWLIFEGANVNLATKTLVADTGGISIIASTLSNGKLRVTDNTESQVRFSGDVTLSGVTWQDEGAGEFVVLNTTARLLGDYEHSLPAGYTCVVWNHFSWQDTRLVLPPGDFQNDGMIEVRHSGGGYALHPRIHLAGPVALLGNGEVFFNYSNANENERPWISGEPGATLTIGPSQWVHGHGEIQVPVLNLGIVEADRKERILKFSGPVENRGIISGVTGGRLVIADGLTNHGDLLIETNSSFTISGVLETASDLVSPAGATLVLENASVDLAGQHLVADRGTIVISASTLENGVLRITDHPNSQIRFSGDVNFTDVPWQDEGAGEFVIMNATARLLGDYERQLPAGYELAIWNNHSWQQAQLTLPAGTYTNNGLLELRHSGGGYAVHPQLLWLGPAELLGSGEVFFNYAAANQSERPWILGAAGVPLTVGPNQWIHGQGEIHMLLQNHGSIVADRKDRALVLAEQVENNGLLQATNGGKLILLKGLSNFGTLAADNSNIEVEGSLFLDGDSRLTTVGTGKIYVGRHLRGSLAALTAAFNSASIVLDGGGVALPDLDLNAFFIEAEDFNFDRGLHEPLANTMPYLGAAFQGKGGRDRIDYHQTDNRTDSDLYRVNEGPSLNVNIYALADMDRGAYFMTNNYKVGRNDAGDWYNYTRTNSPAGAPFYFFARLASGGQPCALQLDEITGSASTTSQSLTKLGEIRGPATGGYDRFVHYPLKAETGDLLELNWAGQKSFRVTVLEGGNEDIDAYVFASAASSGPAQLVEVMGRDLGPDAAGFGDFSFNSLALTAGSIVRLVDQFDNSPGTAPEALYVKSLTVPAGAFLDLGGIALYAQQVQIAGTVSGGSVQTVTGERPRLSINRQGAALQISWPASALGYSLQSTPSILPSASWQAFPTSPAQVGESFLVNDTVGALPRFYRLHHP